MSINCSPPRKKIAKNSRKKYKKLRKLRRKLKGSKDCLIG
jgi:hypothetical protein